MVPLFMPFTVDSPCVQGWHTVFRENRHPSFMLSSETRNKDSVFLEVNRGMMPLIWEVDHFSFIYGTLPIFQVAMLSSWNSRCGDGVEEGGRC